MKVVVWGLGVSGLSAVRYLSQNIELDLYVVSMGAPKTWSDFTEVCRFLPQEKLLAQEDLTENFDVDQVILSPGVPRYLPIIKSLIDRGVEFISDIELAARNINRPIIAITGTNGKTTTTTLISNALKIAGKNVFTGGNIGIGVCDYFLKPERDYDYVVLELSSFQLESISSFRAHIAIILNISENHMERYNDFSEYESAKLNIRINQSSEDWFIAPKKYLTPDVHSKKAIIKKINNLNVINKNLSGDHNLENLFCTNAVLEILDIQNSKLIIKELIETYKGIDFRLQFIKSINKTLFYNDAKSTNTAATIVALNSFSSKKLGLILGGKLRDKGQKLFNDFKDQEIEIIFAIGEAKELINSELETKFKVKKFNGIADIFKDESNFENLDVVLFSPAFPSFDSYKNYMERGKHFNDLVRGI